MNNTTFVYGSEVQGRGYATDMDIAFGIVTTLIGITACTGGVLNLYLIKNLKAFHNAFGFFWVVRTIGELGTDITFAVYTGPVTVIQPTNIPPFLGIFVYHLSYTFAYMQCLMNFIIAWNRFVAVWFPMNYLRVFNAKLCGGVAIYVCCQACIVTSLFFIFPCNQVGYGPRFYANVFVKCDPSIDRDYSILSTLLCKVCFTIACVGTGFVNMTTFCKIVYIRLTSQARAGSKEYKRDVRLFFLGVVQDILMTIVLLSIILCNNQKDLGLFSIVLSYDGLILIYCFNTGSMVLCNPECRRFLFKMKKGAVSSTYATGTGVSSTGKHK
ncbi:hypothetical protein QR680_015485 [Steinernema hermaphroditum]|uniref:7TM GPCR serpentine receptor class x (Srx) domain-containing protein n=1 Tax=Steinernema hermaphroditum TaxID=289476 RepID=A0AA39LKP0_9BILA|nr:hypothetical protein QR680_015485 [Steinernema hermaphroditum]